MNTPALSASRLSVVARRVAREIPGAMTAARFRPRSWPLAAVVIAAMAPLFGGCTNTMLASRSTGAEHVVKVDTALRQKYQAEIEQSLKAGDVAEAVEALRRYQQIDPEDQTNIARWNQQIWSTVAKQDEGLERRQKKAIHRTLVVLREDYPHLPAMNQSAFKRWIGKDTSSAGVPMLSGIAITGHTLKLKVPERNLSQSALSPQKFAQINDAFSVCADATGLLMLPPTRMGFRSTWRG
jgi:hypothetical protein